MWAAGRSRTSERFLAAGERNDIARWLSTDGQHGFLWRVPARGLEETRVDVYDADADRPLRRSPVRLPGGQAMAAGTDES